MQRTGTSGNSLRNRLRVENIDRSKLWTSSTTSDRIGQERQQAERPVGVLHEREELVGRGREDPLLPVAEGEEAGSDW